LGVKIIEVRLAGAAACRGPCAGVLDGGKARLPIAAATTLPVPTSVGAG
jgi:hypothetical protein